jgi:hypothetical protein
MVFPCALVGTLGPTRQATCPQCPVCVPPFYYSGSGSDVPVSKQASPGAPVAPLRAPVKCIRMAWPHVHKNVFGAPVVPFRARLRSVGPIFPAHCPQIHFLVPPWCPLQKGIPWPPPVSFRGPMREGACGPAVPVSTEAPFDAPVVSGPPGTVCKRRPVVFRLCSSGAPSCFRWYSGSSSAVPVFATEEFPCACAVGPACPAPCPQRHFLVPLWCPIVLPLLLLQTFRPSPRQHKQLLVLVVSFRALVGTLDPRPLLVPPWCSVVRVQWIRFFRHRVHKGTCLCLRCVASCSRSR